ncbi:hypothetical protein MVEG_02339 [Podila verticillata NRRL 6337]|nr:hypothetical protein MVEG_02339 [Podila verticillata NRRL 6337]
MSTTDIARDIVTANIRIGRCRVQINTYTAVLNDTRRAHCDLATATDEKLIKSENTRLQRRQNADQMLVIENRHLADDLALIARLEGQLAQLTQNQA